MKTTSKKNHLYLTIEITYLDSSKVIPAQLGFRIKWAISALRKLGLFTIVSHGNGFQFTLTREA